MTSPGQVREHLEKGKHTYNGLSDYEPADVGASGVGAYDDDVIDFVDEGCEPRGERLFPCADRYDYYACRPWTNEACILGTGPCECNWDAEDIGFGGDVCPGTNEDDACHVQIAGADPFCSAN